MDNLRHCAVAHQGDKGRGSRAAGLVVAYKLIESAQTRWRAVNTPQLVALVRAGVVFEKRVMAERSKADEKEVAAQCGDSLGNAGTSAKFRA